MEFLTRPKLLRKNKQTEKQKKKTGNDFFTIFVF